MSSGGALAQLKPDFEQRDAQLRMLELVARGFNENLIVAAEAGTGVGKSLAYLLPTIAWGAEERVIVSTATINLQHQLVTKDIQLALRVLDVELPFMLFKGRGNYLCPARLEDEMEENSLFQERDEQLQQLHSWARQSEDGDVANAPFVPDRRLWQLVNAGACSSRRCRSRSDCFFARLRARLKQASVIVVNHHLLFSDLAARLQGAGFEEDVVLPKFRRVICDEAHEIEQSATSFFSQRISRFAIQWITGRLYRTRKKQAVGLLPRLQRSRTTTISWKQVQAAAQGFDALNDQATKVEQAALAITTEPARIDLRSAPERYRTLFAELQQLAALLRETHRAIAAMLEGLSEETLELPPASEVLLLNRRLQAIVQLIDELEQSGDQHDTICWIEPLPQQRAAIVTTPLEVGPILREALYTPCSTVIFSSATLTVGGRFDYWRSRIGLEPEQPTDDISDPDDFSDSPDFSEPLDRAQPDDVSEPPDRTDPNDFSAPPEAATPSPELPPIAARTAQQSFPSNWDYRTNVLLGICRDAPPPDSPDYASWLADLITRAITIAGGGALVLFTSYKLLETVHAACSPALGNIPVLKQGDEDRSRLLDRFKAQTDSVLFATQSFWEGIDVPGQALRLLIITRLPFQVPTDPIARARQEATTAAGGNAFYHFSLPEAVIRFRQGFGRLMRSANDRGAVLVSDVRLVTKSYGATFLRSIPETRQVITDRPQLMYELENFLYPPDRPQPSG